MLKQQQKDAERKLKMQQQQLKMQETQMRRMQEEQMKQFQDQQRMMMEEQEKQLQLLQQYAQLQQQQQQLQAQNVAAATPGSPTTPVYDYSTLGAYPTAQQHAAAQAAYANAYWAYVYQHNPYLLANYTLPRAPPPPGFPTPAQKKEHGQKRASRPRYRKNRNSREATLVTEDNRRYRSNPDSLDEHSSDLFVSGQDDREEGGQALRNQILAQKNKLKSTEPVLRETNKKEKAANPNQPVFMAELQKKIKDKQKIGDPVPPPQPIPEAIYGDPAAIYGAYVPGGPMVPMPPPIFTPYVAPGAPQVLPNTDNNNIEAVKLMENMNLNPQSNNQDDDDDDGPVLPLATRNQETAPDDEGVNAIYAVPQKRRSTVVREYPSHSRNNPDDYEEQASGLIIDDLDENDTGVVDVGNKELVRMPGRPDDVRSAVFTAETVYGTNEDGLDGDGEGDGEEEGEARLDLGNEDPAAAGVARGAAELGVWREDHGTQRSPPPSYFAFSPEEDNHVNQHLNDNSNNLPRRQQPVVAPTSRRYQKAPGNPRGNPNNRVVRMSNPNPNPNRYPVQPRRSNNCTLQ